MKILWFTNTPCGAAEKISKRNIGGGWLLSLERELNKIPDIDLAISFYSYEYIEPFHSKGTTYYPVYRESSGSKMGRFINRLFNKTNNDSKELTRLIEVIAKFQPDIIHVHGTEENFGLIAEHTKIPVVISIQGILSSIAEKNFSGIPQHVALKNERLREKIFRISAKWVFSYMQKNAERERKILGNASYIIGRTDWDKRVTSVLAPASKYFTLNELLRESFYTRQWNKTGFNKKIQIVTIASNAIYKGFETIVKTGEILASLEGFNFEWQIIGLNRNDSSANIVRKWLKIDFDAINIKFLGIKSEQEILDIFLSSDIYCQVSHIENSSNSLCEAMIIGMPIVASVAGGTDSMLEHKKEGILVQEGDPYSLAGAILELLFDFELSIQYATKARKKALERHKRESIINSIMGIYQSLFERLNSRIEIKEFRGNR